MDARTLYQEYLQLRELRNGRKTDEWGKLDPIEKDVWEGMADFVTNHVSECISNIFK